MNQSFVALRYYRKPIIIGAVIVAVVAGALSFTLPLKYSASVRLLITQRAAFTLDPYTAIRSNELIAQHLAQVVVTSSFLDKVLDPQFQIDKNYFNRDERARRKLWGQTISAAPQHGEGLIEIIAYHADPKEAIKIASAVSFLLSTQGGDYIGRDITVRLVDAPLTSRFPVRPNIPLNMAVGAVLGALLGGLWVFMKQSKKKRGHE